MVFVLIQFDESDGGTIAIIHKSWMIPRKTEVYWPPVKNQSTFDRALLNGHPADISSWELYKIKRTFAAYGM